MPDSGPRLVRPRETKRKIRLLEPQHLTERPFQNSATRKPIVPVAETLYTMGPSELGLGPPCLRYAKIVEAELTRNTRLVVPPEQRTSLGDVSPLTESGSPPLVVLGDRMELRKIERDN